MGAESTTTTNQTNTAPAAGTQTKTAAAAPIIVASYPPDLGSSKSPVPYMLISIFETQVGTQTSNDDTSKSIRTGIERAYNAYNTITGGSTTLQGIGIGAALNGVGGAIAGGALGLFSGTALGVANSALNAAFNTQNVDYVSQAKSQIKNFSLKRNESRLSSQLALFMPESMSASYDQDFEGVSVTQALGTLGFLAQAVGARGEGQNPSKTNVSNPYLMEGISTLGSKATGSDISKLMTFATTGTVVNPQIELLYTSPVLRKFTFDFRFVPRNKTESEVLFGKETASRSNLIDLGLINLLKYFSAPILVENAGGRYYVPPAQFMLEFWYNDPTNSVKINKNLFKTKRCVLESVNLDYGPNGFAMHYDGAPVEVRMQLTFQETVMLDREAIKEGY